MANKIRKTKYIQCLFFVVLMSIQSFYRPVVCHGDDGHVSLEVHLHQQCDNYNNKETQHGLDLCEHDLNTCLDIPLDLNISKVSNLHCYRLLKNTLSNQTLTENYASNDVNIEHQFIKYRLNPRFISSIILIV